MRIFIGDIQGCREELEELLAAVNFDSSRDELHPVGDLVNRGPDSLGVLRLLRDYDAGGVLGNHDINTLLRHRWKRRAKSRDTLDELYSAPDCESLLQWLAARPVVRAWDDLLCVHAAFSPAWKDPTQELANLDPWGNSAALSFATRTRYCGPRGELPKSDWPPPPAPFQAWYKFWQHRPGESRTVVFGHWARNGLVVEERVRGLDTGCVWGRQLTAWIAEEDRIVQVDAKKVHSPATLSE